MFIVFSWWVNTCLFRRLGKVYDFSHCTHLCGFSPEWVTMCLFRWYFCPNDLLHSAQLCDFSSVWVTMCAFKFPSCTNVFSQTLHLWVFLQLEFPCAASIVHFLQMTCRTVHNCMLLFQCEWADVSWDWKVVWRTHCTARTWKAFLLCGWACVSAGLSYGQMTFRILHTWMRLFQCEWADVSWDWEVERLLSTVDSHVSLHVFTKEFSTQGIFVWLLSSVSWHVHSKRCDLARTLNARRNVVSNEVVNTY